MAICICLQRQTEGAEEADGDDAWEEKEEEEEEEETNGAKGVDADDEANKRGAPEPERSGISVGASPSELEIDVDDFDEVPLDEDSTVDQNSQESGRKCWAIRSSVRSFVRTIHSFALHCSIHSHAPLRSFVFLHAHSLPSSCENE